MEHLTRGVRDAVAKESWYAALALALTLPDTCGAIDDPGPNKSRKRYTTWADTFLSKYFHLASPPSQFFTSKDLYFLRCSFLHEGDFDVEPNAPPSSDPDSAKAMFSVLNHVDLVVSDHQVIMSRGITNTDPAQPRTTHIQIAVKDLCEWICQGVEAWLPQARADARSAKMLGQLGRITVWQRYQRSIL
jgi:hypothetical protein